MGTAGLMRAGAMLSLMLLALLVVPARTAPTSDASPPPCVRGCRCAALQEPPSALAVNCSSPAAAAALGSGPLGSRVRELRLTRHDDHLSVKEGAFHSLVALQSLHLDHLGLVKVYPGAFRGLDALEELDLSHNALSAGDEISRALRDLPQLRRLYLRGNNFGSANGVAPTLISRTLKFVDLGRCKLRDLPPSVLGGLSHVRHVVLDGNFIRQFKATSFPRSIVSLDLSHNDIDRIPLKELNELENVDAIELADNPLHCSCDLWQITYDYNINKEIICASPKQLMGKNLLSLKKHQLCGVHKKVKREAGNELDDETLSGEETGDDLEEASPLNEENKKDAASKTEHEENQKQDSENDPETSHKTTLEETGLQDSDNLKEEGGDTEAEEVEEFEGDGAGPEHIYGEESVDPTAYDKNHEKTHLEGDRLTSGDKSEPIEDDESPEELVYEPNMKETPVDEEVYDEYDNSKANVDDTPVNEKKEYTEGEEIVDGDTATDGSLIAEEKPADEKDEKYHDPVDGIKEDVGDAVNEGEDRAAGLMPQTDNGDDEDSKELSVTGSSINAGGSAEEKVSEGESDKTDDNFEDSANEEENPPDSLPPSEYTRMQAAQEQENKKNDEETIEEINSGETQNAGVFPNLSEYNGEETRTENERTEEKPTVQGSDSEDGNIPAAVGAGESETTPEENEKIISPIDENLEISSDKIESRDGKSEISDSDQNGRSELPDGQIVETVEDNENVVHTNEVGARIEDGSENESNAREEEVDGAASDYDTGENENGDVEEKSLDEIEAKIEAEEADLVEKEKEYDVKERTEGEETLEEELEKDRLHSTLGHVDLAQENEESEREIPFEDTEIHGSPENDGSLEPMVEEKSATENLPVSSDGEEKENKNEKDDAVDGVETNEENDGFIPRVAPEVEGQTDEKEYEEIKGGKDTGAPGDSISIAEDTEESDEEEGSGTRVEVPVHEIVRTDDNANDWNDGDVNETENEAVPPLDNAESTEVHQVEGTMSEEKSEPGETHPGEVIVPGGSDEEGSGVGLLDRIPLDRGDEEPASNENDDVYGSLLPTVHAPEEEDEEEEESSGNEPFIPIVPDFQDSSDKEKTVVDNEDTGDKDTGDKDNSQKESFIPSDIEEDSIPRRKVPLHSAPPRPHDTHDKKDEDHEHTDKNGPGLSPVEKVENDSVDPVSAPDDVDSDVEGAEDILGTNENVLAAVPDTDSSADGSEALNKEGAFNFNTIASYIVLGAIMLLVVILLAYAVCRSRRQKSTTANGKDVENPGREMHDVNKPLINNHHPSAPEKQPLDETQQPLMTKEQEASLSLDPSEKIPLTQDETDHKPKQNGEVVVEQRPIANGKAASPATIRAPSPAALSASLPDAPAAPAPASSPVTLPSLVAPASPAASPPHSPTHSPVADGHMNGNALPLANGGTHTPPRAASPALPASSPASGQPPVSPGAVRVVAKELPDSVAKRPVIIMNRGADPAQQV